MDATEIAGWESELVDFLGEFDDCFGRSEPREHADPEAIGIIDETGHPKKGKHTAGVKRQWCQNTGKVDPGAPGRGQRSHRLRGW